MPTIRSTLVLCLLLLLVLATPALAAQRVVLLESFTNVSCVPCASANPITHSVVEDYGTLMVLNVQYHMSWPSGADPFYLTDTADCDGRRSYYGVNAVPDLATDGVNSPEPGSAGALETMLDNRLATDSPLEIAVSTQLVGDQLTVTADIDAVAAIPSGLVCRIALVEPYVDAGSPPGSNGETEFYCTMRDMLPSHAGTALTLAEGGSTQVVETGTLDPSWTDVYAVVWVQDDADKSVLQAASSLVNTADYAYFFGSNHRVDIAGSGEVVVQPAVMTNLGLQTDSYDVHIVRDLPADWSASVCEGAVCYPPFVDDIVVGLNAGEQTDMTVDITVGAEVGVGSVTLEAVSTNDPSLTFSREFRVIHDGTKILCVDDDGGYAYERYYENSLQAYGQPWASWDLAGDGKLAAPDLENFFAVVWNVGLGYPTVEADDRAAIAAYLENGGHLFISGQDIGWDIFDAGGYEYGAAAQAWYRTYLGANYVSDDTNDLTIQGVAGDPIGDGLAFNIGGGDGANNQAYPSEIEPYGTGEACLIYSAGREAAVRNQAGSWRSVYCAFGFEGVATQADRDLLMARILDWLGVNGPTGVEDGAVAPAAVAGLANHPNPFNPATDIAFAITGGRAATTAVDVFDVSGARVRTLFRGELEPGDHVLHWDGRDADGRALASGVYLAEVRVGEGRTFLKMTLLK